MLKNQRKMPFENERNNEKFIIFAHFFPFFCIFWMEIKLRLDNIKNVINGVISTETA